MKNGCMAATSGNIPIELITYAPNILFEILAIMYERGRQGSISMELNLSELDLQKM